MIIRDILNLKGDVIFSIGPERSVAEAVEVMVENDIGSLVVMSGRDMLGMITFREILRALHWGRGSLAGDTVQAHMVRDPVAGSPQDSVDQVRKVMTENHVRYLPVVEGDRLLGVISFHDVARACLNQADFENRMLKRFMKNWPE